MRRLFLCLAIGLLCTTFAVAQSGSSPQSAPPPTATQSGQNPSQPSQPPSDARPARPADQQAAQPDRDRAKSDADAAAASRSQADQNAAQADRDRQAADQNAAAANQNAQRASSPVGGIPWGWIVLGVVVVAVILALIGRGADRTERIDRVETINRSDRDVVVRDRRDDDIRRVG